MDDDQKFLQRERRFEVNELIGFDAVVSRAGCEDSLFYAELIDFSRKGGKFNLPFCARFDEILNIKFQFKNSDITYHGEGRVRHIRHISENCWQVGCSIDPELPEEVISYLAKKTNQERRKFPRFEIQGDGSLRRQGSTDGCDATIQNVSRGGVCIRVDNEQEIGAPIEFLIVDKNGDEQVVSARIRWQKEVDDGYELGCSFGDSASYNKLVDCLSRRKPNSKTRLLILAAMILALIVPSISMYFTKSNSTAKRQQSPIAEVKSPGRPETDNREDPIDDSSIELEDGLTGNKRLESESNGELAESSIVESELPSTSGTQTESQSEIVQSEQVGPKPGVAKTNESPKLPKPPKQFVTTTRPRSAKQPARPGMERDSSRRMVRTSGRKSHADQRNSMTMELTPGSNNGDKIAESKLSSRQSQRLESPINVPPTVLTEKISSSHELKKSDRGSTRRIKAKRPIIVPYEEIKPSR